MTQEPESRDFAEVSANLKAVIDDQVSLAKSELAPAAKHVAVGSGMFGAAGVFALHALWMLLIGGALAVGWLYDSVTKLGPWGSFVLGFLTVAVLSLLIAGLLAMFGSGQFKKVKKPEATIEELNKTIADLRLALSKKSADATVVAQAQALADAEALVSANE